MMNNTFDFESLRLSLSTSLNELQAAMVAYLPKILVAALVLLLGWLVSKLFEIVVRSVLRRVGVDRVAERFGLSGPLGQAGISTPLSVVLAKVVFWIVLVAFASTAVSTLGISALEPALDRLITFLPNLVAALIILFGGLLVARLARNLVDSGAETMGMPGAGWLGSGVYLFLLLLSAMIALEQIGVGTTALILAVTAITASVGLTAGIALAIGSRGILEHILAGHYLRQSLTVGQYARVGDRKGAVEQVGPVSTLFRDGDERWSIPNRQLLDEIIRY
jgi:small-conductance mechanosensitive channel